MNIFQKNCPECAAPNSAEAMSCRCGYCFDPEGLAEGDPAEYAQQQDRLYRDYLAARIAQAEAELTVARERANADPESTIKASSALLAEQALNALHAEMKQLSLRISVAAPARRPVTARRPINPPNRPAPARTLPPRVNTRVTPNPLPNPMRRPFAPPRAPAPRPEPQVQRKPRAAATAIGTLSKIVSATRAVLTAAPVVAKRQTRPAMIAAAANRPHAPTKPTPPVSTPVNGKKRVVPNITNRPDQSFRLRQTQKAEAIARSKSTPPVAPPRQVHTKSAPQPAPADIPPVAVSKREPTQECPNCTAAVAAGSIRCSCGYMLGRPGEEVPALTLDATALAILTEGISFSSSNRRR